MAYPRIVRLVCVFFLCLGLCAGCGFIGTSDEDVSYKPELIVTGDVQNELSLTDLSDFTLQPVENGDEVLSGAVVGDLLSAAGVVGESLTVYFVSPDGVMASMPIEQAMDCALCFASTGWTLLAHNHPPQASMKRLSHIVVCAGTFEQDERCLRIINGDRTTTLSYGQLFLQDSVSSVVLEGQPQRKVDGVTYSVDAYTRRALIPLSGLTGISAGTALCYLGSGEQVEIDLSGYLEWRGNSADYIAPNKRSRLCDVIGIWLNAPEASVMDVADLSLDALSSGRVLVIEIDGLGYGAYRQFVAGGCDTLGRFKAKAARTVMPSISNVALAAIITGETPDKTGVTERKSRQIVIPDMFSSAVSMGRTCAVIEGNSALVTMSLDQTLNADTGGNGSTDNEVQQSALAALSSGTDLIYVHFHGMDDVSHDFGPFSAEATAKAQELNAYIGELLSQFKGTAVLISDHGMHDVNLTDKLGMHGTFVSIDMTVPLGVLTVQ